MFMQKKECLLLPVLFLPWLLFHGSIPGGFYTDETTGVAHAICFNNFLINYQGIEWPYFSEATNGGGGHNSPAYFYPLVMWTAVFGHSIASVRFFSTVITLATVAVMFFVGRRLGFAKNSIAILVIAALSPWAFQYSRLAWDPPIALLYFFVSLYFGLQYRNVKGLMLVSAFSALAMHAYGPFKLAVPLFWSGWVLFNRWPLKDCIAFALMSFLLIVPLLYFSFYGEGVNRFNEVSIFGDYGLNPVAYESLDVRLLEMLKNLFLHYDPRFLFWSGDQNIRHSPPFTGQLSIFSLAVVIVFSAGVVQKKILLEDRRLWFFCLWAIFCFFMPSATTYDHVPHSLRAIGAWPFFVILFAYMLDKIRPHVNYLLIIVAVLIQFIYFHYNYHQYGKQYNHWFDEGAIYNIQRNRNNLDSVDYHKIAKFYHAVRLGWLTKEQMLQACQTEGNYDKFGEHQLGSGQTHKKKLR